MTSSGGSSLGWCLMELLKPPSSKVLVSADIFAVVGVPVSHDIRLEGSYSHQPLQVASRSGLTIVPGSLAKHLLPNNIIAKAIVLERSKSPVICR